MAISQTTKRLAVLIDGENISSGHAALLFEEVLKLGIPTIRRVYGRAHALAGWREKSKTFWIGMHRVLPGKNATDMKLAIDAVDLLHRRKLDGFCIVSSDRDFTELAMHLSRQGAYVVGLGKDSAAACYRDACHTFVPLVLKVAAPVVAKPIDKLGSQPAVVSKSQVKDGPGSQIVTDIQSKRIEQKLKSVANGRQHVPLAELGNHLPKGKTGQGKLKTRLKAQGLTLVKDEKGLMVRVPQAISGGHFGAGRNPSPVLQPPQKAERPHDGPRLPPG